jgi:hypothetical protein
MLIGYARVSTDDQNLGLQRTALGEAGCARLYEEKVSGASRNRPELTRLGKRANVVEGSVRENLSAFLRGIAASWPE